MHLLTRCSGGGALACPVTHHVVDIEDYQLVRHPFSFQTRVPLRPRTAAAAAASGRSRADATFSPCLLRRSVRRWKRPPAAWSRLSAGKGKPGLHPQESRSRQARQRDREASLEWGPAGTTPPLLLLLGPGWSDPTGLSSGERSRQ